YKDPDGNNVSFNDIHILTISKDTNHISWEKLEIPDSPLSPRSGATAVQISPNEVLFFGGVQLGAPNSKGLYPSNTYFNDICVLNLQDKTCKQILQNQQIDNSYTTWFSAKLYGDSIVALEHEKFPAAREGHTLNYIKAENKLI